MHKFYPQYNNYSVDEEEWDGFCEALERVLAAHTWCTHQAPHHEYATAHGCMQKSTWVANKILNLQLPREQKIK
jgi:hypothetical protein